MIVNSGKSAFITQINSILSEGGVGISNTAENASDSGLFGGGTTIDEMDSSNSTNWTEGGDALNPSDLTSSGEFQHGTGCMGVGWNYSTGSATYERTISSTDLSDKEVYSWFYISDKSALATGSNSIRVSLGTGSTDTYYYDFSYDDLISGWNTLRILPNTISGSTGAGATLTGITYVKYEFNQTANVTVGNARLDYLRYYSPDTLGITEATANLSKTTGSFYIRTTHSVGPNYANGVDVVEVADTDGTTVLSRTTIPAVTKGLATELQIDKYYYWEG